MTNGELQRIRTALVMLGNRKMANLGADLKVARLLRFLEPYGEPLETLKKSVAMEMYRAEVPDGATLTSIQEQVLFLAIGEKQAEVDALEVAIELPVQFALKEADLPKELAGKEGALNAAGLGALVADLGPLYVMMDEG